jgi:hypothetical protein
MTRTLTIRNGDVIIQRSSGRLDSTDGLNKARQQLNRLLALNAPAGAGLDQLVGTMPSDAFSLSASVQRRIRAAFDVLVRLQVERQLRDRTDDERFASLARMFVVPARFQGQPESKTAYALRVDALTIAGLGVTINELLAAPQGG